MEIVDRRMLTQVSPIVAVELASCRENLIEFRTKEVVNG